MKSWKKSGGRLLAMSVAASVAAAGPVGGAESGSEAENRDEQAQSGDAGNDIVFLKSQGEHDWLASALIGRNVHDSQGNSLGDINDVLLKDGQIRAVLIGVGGFLGLGQKEVAVSASALEFRKKGESGAYQQGWQLPRSLRNQDRESDDPQASGKAGAGGEARKSEEAVKRSDDRHSDMYLVLNVTKEQLEAAPSFARLGQTSGEENKKSEQRDSDDSDDSAADRTNVQ